METIINYGKPGLPNKEFYRVCVEQESIIVTPQDYYPGAFQELKHLGAQWNPKTYSFITSRSKENTIKAMLNFYTKPSTTPTAKLKTAMREVEAILGHKDALVTHYNGNVVLVDPYGLVGDLSVIKELSQDLIHSTYLKNTHSVRTIFNLL